uniref:Peptidase S9 prolyl oligopeptidase catalytic domain-containing protein n=1 Tax=Clastoptera arizonana TaxID=38151 RepID=A0A1B6C6F4_9HEMI
MFCDSLWVQLLDRRQQRLELVLISLDNFVEPPPNVYHNENHLDSMESPLVIWTETSDIWMNVHDLLHMFPIDENGNLSFIWASEETGFRHLYYITTYLGSASNGLQDSVDGSEGIPVMSCRSTKIALTSGEWEVLGRDLWVDEERQLVYFIGLRETPLEKHLYVVWLKRPGDIRLLTKPGFSYTADINVDCSICVIIYSSIESPPACQVFRIVHMGNSNVDWSINSITLKPLGYLLEPEVTSSDLHCPLLYTCKLISGVPLFSMVFKPHNFECGQKYPTVLYVYGGPEVQQVSNTFKGMRHLRMHMLAAQGYAVVAIDSRGSHHRGVVFESYLKGRMGTVELQDQIEVLQHLSERLGFLDMNRIAIHGWSYGGYLSLMGLAQYPDIFKVAIAGAPVTSWSLYDTGYTERYMDLPQNNLQGYKAGSILNYVNQFPDEENRVLIIHGLIDENVHFYHSSQLINAMVRAGKPYQLQVYPNERHSLRNLDASKHYETTLLSFLQNHL